MSKFLVVMVILMGFVCSANAQKTKLKFASTPVVQTKVDLGKLNGNTYTNNFFELKFVFEYGWLVGDNALESQLIAIQKANVKTKNAKSQAVLNTAMSRITPLLGGYKSLPGSVAENSNLRVVVESLASTPKIRTNLDYLNNLRASLSLTKLPKGFTYSFIKNELIGGEVLLYIETSYQSNRRRSYVIVRKEFAILMTIDAYNEKDFDALHQVLETSDLNYKK